ncbi:MAG: ASCH domain-containing protein [Acidimicrobiales bacterium]
MEFSRKLRSSVLSGDITVSFRLWQRPQVKAGGRYHVGDGQIEVDSVEMIPFAFIEEADIRRTGEADMESLRQRAAHAGPIRDETVLYRIEFHVVA